MHQARFFSLTVLCATHTYHFLCLTHPYLKALRLSLQIVPNDDNRLVGWGVEGTVDNERVVGRGADFSGQAALVRVRSAGEVRVPGKGNDLLHFAAGHRQRPVHPARRPRLVTGCCCWLLNVPATCECISGTDLLRQFYVLPH